MSELVHKVPGMSWSQVEIQSEQALTTLAPECLDRPTAVPIQQVLEFRLGLLEPDTIFCVKELPYGYEGSVDWDVEESRFEVALAPFVYEGLTKGFGRDRMTAAHELGHFVLHRDIIRQIRIAESCQKASALGLFFRTSGSVAPWEDPERQAEVFAGRFLVPRATALPAMTHYGLNARSQLGVTYQISDSAAAVRLRELRSGV